MKFEGWTLSELAGELISRGVDIDDVDPQDIMRRLPYERVERVAEEIAREQGS